MARGNKGTNKVVSRSMIGKATVIGSKSYPRKSGHGHSRSQSTRYGISHRK